MRTAGVSTSSRIFVVVLVRLLLLDSSCYRRVKRLKCSEISGWVLRQNSGTVQPGWLMPQPPRIVSPHLAQQAAHEQAAVSEPANSASNLAPCRSLEGDCDAASYLHMIADVHERISDQIRNLAE